MHKVLIIFCIIILLPFWNLQAQNNLDKGHAVLINFGMGTHIPGGDLADRFGRSIDANISSEWLMPTKPWGIAIQGNYIFGRDVKTDVLDNIRTETGSIIGNDFLPADVFLRQRGWTAGLGVYRYVPFSKSKDFFGLKLGLGISYIQHWIRLQDDSETALQIREPYDQGYDRLTEGIALTQFIGVAFLDQKKRINFFAGFEFIQGFTKSARPWNFDERRADTDRRLDLLSGIKLGWTLPIYFQDKGEEIFY